MKNWCQKMICDNPTLLEHKRLYTRAKVFWSTWVWWSHIDPLKSTLRFFDPPSFFENCDFDPVPDRKSTKHFESVSKYPTGILFEYVVRFTMNIFWSGSIQLLKYQSEISQHTRVDQNIHKRTSWKKPETKNPKFISAVNYLCGLWLLNSLTVQKNISICTINIGWTR